jgi:hypothetical protein
MIGTRQDPGYLALRNLGYRFTNTGVLLGDRHGDAAASWYEVNGPDGALIDYRKGMVSAYELALRHYRKRQEAANIVV